MKKVLLEGQFWAASQVFGMHDIEMIPDRYLAQVLHVNPTIVAARTA